MRYFLVIATLLALGGCITGQQAASIKDVVSGLYAGGGSAQNTAVSNSLVPSTEEIAAGLKEALKVGSKDAASALSASGGYYKNDAYKILLPPDAEKIVTNISKIPGGQRMLDDVVLRINSSAESAAKTAAPIFVDAISDMSITDAVGILKGSDTSATEYLKSTTTTDLKDAYRPYMQEALAEPLVAGISADKSWNTLKTSYNKVAGSFVGSFAGMETVESDLDEYVLDQAIQGMFGEVAVQEKEIRANPMAYTSDIIQRVFGYAKAERN
ncbi:MAG: DUF4197 domain-containing protein [Deferribacteraceae bacterium]|jgi:hypothetical protein|nr:DUF4197 domain-containing protein [Deferribacteraceae bacterium]